MSNPITLDYKGEHYVLEFDRKTVKQLMGNGLNMDYFSNNPIDAIPRLFKASFFKNHRRTTENVKDEIFKLISDKEGLYQALIELYLEPIQELMDEPEDESSKITWGRG